MSDNSHRWPGIETASGLWFNYTDPSPEAVALDDIASSLGNTCRWRGQIRKFYSVAEHAIKVSDLVREVADPELALHALHHDSHEAYVGDVPTPLKRLLGEAYENMTAKVDWAICQSLDLDRSLLEHDIVKEADALALRYEAALLKPSQGAALPGWNYDEPLDPPSWWKTHYGWTPAYATMQFTKWDGYLRRVTGRA